MKAADLTVVANFHREGSLAHPALRSGFLAVDAAVRHGVRARILAVLDRPDAATRDEVARFGDRLHGTVEIDEGDLSTARNVGLQWVETPWVAFLDGDDLFDRDWLWKGLRHLQEDGGGNAVAHAAIRLTFGNERRGRVQISSESPLFHPLNLIASWHWAADTIAPVDLLRSLPFVPNDHAAGFGAEDWLWTCESLLAGVRHLVVPETVYFYRRQARHLSLGKVPGKTFRPNRLLDADVVARLLRTHPLPALRAADPPEESAPPVEGGSGPPAWLRAAVHRLARIDLDVHALGRELATVPLHTMSLFPEVGHLYVKLIGAFGKGRGQVVFLCDRLSPEALAGIGGFLRAHARRRSPDLDVLVVSLAVPDVQAPTSDAGGTLAQVSDTPWLRLRHVDLGAEATYAGLADRTRQTLIVRFLLQVRPLLAAGVDSGDFDQIVAKWADTLRSGGVHTARLLGSCYRGDDAFIAALRILDSANAGYSILASSDAEVARRLADELPLPDQVSIALPDGTDDSEEATDAVLLGLLDGSAAPASRADERPLAPPGAARHSGASPVPDLSCVLIARSEGRRLIGTLRALADACGGLRHAGRTAEVIVVADRPGPRTRGVLSSLSTRVPGARLVEADVGDDAAAVNAGVAAARGQHVALLGGGDAVTPGFLLRALRLAEAEGPETIARPGVVVEPGQTLAAVEQADMRDESLDIGLLAGGDLWAPVALARRDLFRRFPWREAAPGSGWGHAAWHWSCETVQAGCRHVAVPQTAVFRLAGASGERDIAVGPRGWVTLPPSRFFAEHPWLVGSRSTPASASRGLPSDTRDAAATDWLLAEASRMAASVPDLAAQTLPGEIRRPLRSSSAREVYRTCWEVMRQTRPTHVLLVPWVGWGGSELAASLCVDAILSRPQNRVLVVCTQPRKASSRAALAERAAVLPFAEIAGDCPFDERVDVLTRLLVNSPARSLHVFYSGVGWEVLRRHAAPLAQLLRIFVSVFSVPPFETGRKAGYASGLAATRRHITTVFTDNTRAADAMVHACGLERGQVVVLRHPVSPRASFPGSVSGGDLVLWAGRLDPCKRPELLREIAERLPGRRFDVWGSPVLSDGQQFASLASLRNVRLRGPFAGFNSIPDAPYHCFLYTSQWDGLPNVLLEAVGSGLLAVGSDVGGVREVLGDGGGILVRPSGDPGAYVEALQRSFRDLAWARERAERGRRRIVETHTREGFLAALASAPGYL